MPSEVIYQERDWSATSSAFSQDFTWLQFGSGSRPARSRRPSAKCRFWSAMCRHTRPTRPRHASIASRSCRQGGRPNPHAGDCGGTSFIHPTSKPASRQALIKSGCSGKGAPFLSGFALPTTATPKLASSASTAERYHDFRFTFMVSSPRKAAAIRGRLRPSVCVFVPSLEALFLLLHSLKGIRRFFGISHRVLRPVASQRKPGRVKCPGHGFRCFCNFLKRVRRRGSVGCQLPGSGGRVSTRC